MRKFVFLLLVALSIPGIVHAADEGTAVKLLVGRSAIVDFGSAIARVSLTSPDIADALVTAPNQLLVNGKMPGTISMFVWDRSGAIRRYEVIVQRDLARLNDQMKTLFPGEAIDAQSSGKSVVLSGIVTSKEVAERAVNVAAGYVDKKEEVVTLLQMRESEASNQVLLQVRFAEVSRSALTELGVSLFTGANGYKDILARTTTQGVAPGPIFDNSGNGDNKLVFSDFLNLFLFDAKHQLGAVIKALTNKGLFQSLAEPNLVAESGKEASFLAGGEFPIPVAQGTGSNTSISVQFKEFGIRLNFTPLVTGNRVHLKVRPEVSTLDFANAVVLQGFRIPALTTRRTETELELMDGQTFAIAGLINNTMNNTLQKIPGIGDIPILGLLFKSKSAQKNLTELVVMITPHILPRNSPGVTTQEPQLLEPYMAPVPQKNQIAPPPPAFRQPPPMRTGSVMPAPTSTVASPADAAATLLKSSQSSLPVMRTDAETETTGNAAVRPLTSDELKALGRSHKQDESKKASDAQERMKQVQVDREQDRAGQQQRAKQATEQGKRDEAAARVAAEQAKNQAKIDAKAAKIAAEQTKRQSALEQERQKALDEAAAIAKAAEARYQTELAKKQQR
jgi:pilus assembly protein CpaC